MLVKDDTISLGRETFSLLRNSGFIILFSALLPGLLGAFALMAQRNSGTLLFGTGGFPLWVLAIFAAILLPLAICFWTVNSFHADDFAARERIPRLFAFRSLAIIFATLLVMLVVLLFSEIAGLFLSILGTGILQALPPLLRDYARVLAALILFMSMAIFLVQCFRRRSTALGAVILLFIGLRSLAWYYPGLDWINPAAVMDSYLNLNIQPPLPTAYLPVLCGQLALAMLFWLAGFWMYKRTGGSRGWA